MTAAPTASVVKAIQDLTCSYQCRGEGGREGEGSEGITKPPPAMCAQVMVLTNVPPVFKHCRSFPEGLIDLRRAPRPPRPLGPHRFTESQRGETGWGLLQG